jgi:hypothetical protein
MTEQPNWDDFQPPPEEIEELHELSPEFPEAAAAQTLAAEAAPEVAAVSEAPSPLLEAREAIDELFSSRASGQPSALAIDSLAGSGNIQGVAIGVGDEISALAAGTPGESTLTLYVAEPASTDEMRSVLVDSLGLKAAGDIPIKVNVTGIIRALPHTFKERPSPCGISVAHQNVTAGTQGCLCFGRQEPRNNRVMILSNNHVLANVNAASAGDCICQPGPADGGSCPGDQVAVLERFVPIDFSGPNVVDCATAWAWPDRVRIEQVYLSNGSPTFFRTGNTPVEPKIGMEVGKSGRTTQLKKGRIDGVGGSFAVSYEGVGVAHFQDTIVVRGVAGGGTFSQGGDSGSLIWQWDSGVAPVGLLFAGSTNTATGDEFTMANRIDSVMSALDIWLYA